MNSNKQEEKEIIYEMEQLQNEIDEIEKNK